MRSWDCWDTLIARRSVWDIRNETDNVFPIAENVSRVRPEDLLVSDYYDARLLERLIPDVTGLRNRIIVSEDGKRSGRIWPEVSRLGVTQHCGDDTHSDVVSPQAHGITGTLFAGSKLTQDEQALSDAGLDSLARCMREARLTQYSERWRKLESLQTQINFPLLFLASLILQREHRAERFLMSSRDCFLWHKLQEFIRDRHGHDYEVVYFHTSRLARAFPSPAYLEYLQRLLPAVIVDVVGTGWSLSRLLSRAGRPDTPIVLITRYVDAELRAQYEAIGSTRAEGNVFTLLRAPASFANLEGMNLAAHAMYLDPPETFNPLGLDWERLAEIQAMHAAFFAALNAAIHYGFRRDFEVTNDVLQEQLQRCFARAGEHLEWSAAVQNLSTAEHQAVMHRLAQIARSVESRDAL